MLRRTRLRKSLDFRRVYRARSGHGAKFMVLHALPNGLDHPRIGFSISTKVGGSVQRHLVKRRLRAAADTLVRDEPVGLDLIVVARPGSPKAAYAELAAEFVSLYRRAAARLNTGPGVRAGSGDTLD